MPKAQTAQEPPVELPLKAGGEPEPRPKAGCAACAHQAQLRDVARANGDGSSVSDLNVRMRRHLKADH